MTAYLEKFRMAKMSSSTTYTKRGSSVINGRLVGSRECPGCNGTGAAPGALVREMDRRATGRHPVVEDLLCVVCDGEGRQDVWESER